MKCIIIGAGNAGRPVARILNHTGNQVIITDRKILEEFPPGVQKTIKTMEDEGVELMLGSDASKGIEKVDHAYVSPTVPGNSPIRKLLQDKQVKILDNDYVSKVINDILDLDIIGITGTLGKTSTTHILSDIFQSAGYNVWTCSSRMGNLLSEVIVDGIVNGLHKINDIAILELPHGTSRLMSKVDLNIGVITNIYPDHLDEFEYSMEKYVARKLFIVDSSKILVSGMQCINYLEDLRDDTIYYCQENSKCNVNGKLKDGILDITYDMPNLNINGHFETSFKLLGYYIENSIAASAAALAYGLDGNSIIKGLNSFKGIAGHMEYIGNFKGREVHFDAAFVPEGLVSTLESFQNQELIVIVDNPDSTNPRDKYKVGEVVGKYANVLICSGYNETTKKFNIEAANEVIQGAEKSSAIKIPVDDMFTAGELSIKHSHPGCTILHVGPGAITNYEDVKTKMMSGIKEGCKKYD
ncbi:MAG: Mur ligase family protein [Methanobacterium sp.]|uniref:Mur ligase family protein n=2 Tax=Methanobacterium sp. TaxID=2164 RepID=UPI003C720237